MKNKLVLGAGNKTRTDAINADIHQYGNIDMLIDLNIHPWFEIKSQVPEPGDELPENYFEEVWAEDILEHLLYPIEDMEEIYRICKPMAKIHISVPEFGKINHYNDPTHLRGYGIDSFDFCDHSSEHWKKYKYTKCNFKIIERELKDNNVVIEMLVIK